MKYRIWDRSRDVFCNTFLSFSDERLLLETLEFFEIIVGICGQADANSNASKIFGQRMPISLQIQN